MSPIRIESAEHVACHVIVWGVTAAGVFSALHACKRKRLDLPMDTYQLDEYYAFMADAPKMRAYQQALERFSPGKVVLDLGAGLAPLGFMALRAGARKLYVVERGPVLELARRAALQMGLLDRVVFIRGLSSQLDLPEKVDVIVTETFGSLGIEENATEFLIDARERFLAPGGVMIPNRLEVYLGLCQEPQYEAELGFWKNAFGLDYSSVIEQAASRKRSVELPYESLLTAPQVLCDLDFMKVLRPTFSRFFTFVVQRAGILNSFCGWFEATLGEGITINTAPGREPTHWKQGILPLSRPFAVLPGDEVFVWFDASPSPNRRDDLSIQFKLALKRHN